MRSTPLWKVYLTRAAAPIGIVVSIVFLGWAVGSAIQSTPDERAFDVACSVAGGSIEFVNGVGFCVEDVEMEIAVPKTLVELCNEVDGEVKKGPYDRTRNSYIYECRKQVVVEELGARHEYTVNH